MNTYHVTNPTSDNGLHSASHDFKQAVKVVAKSEIHDNWQLISFLIRQFSIKISPVSSIFSFFMFRCKIDFWHLLASGDNELVVVGPIFALVLSPPSAVCLLNLPPRQESIRPCEQAINTNPAYIYLSFETVLDEHQPEPFSLFNCNIDNTPAVLLELVQSEIWYRI